MTDELDAFIGYKEEIKISDDEEDIDKKQNESGDEYWEEKSE